jgi:glycosyltransferase involved in cell wall biosynthesis
MVKKIKILFYSHTIDFGGTWRSHERIIKNIDKDIFDVYVFYNPKKDNNRIEIVKEIIGSDKLIPFIASDEKSGPENGYKYLTTNFEELCEKMSFDIIHFARSGYYEWPFINRLAPIQIETNIFGFSDKSSYLDYSVTICDTIRNRRGGSDATIFNPIPDKINNDDTLNVELQIPENYFVFGRIGRKDNFHSIALKAIYELKKVRNDFKYIIIGACNSAINTINQLNLNDVCIVVETTNDDYFIHKFYNTIDLFLHYRSDGECHSTAISQSLAYGVPVISHYAGYNGQEETIKDSGFVVNNEFEYVDKILQMITNDELRKDKSKKALERFKDFEELKITKEWENVYLTNYKNKF